MMLEMHLIVAHPGPGTFRTIRSPGFLLSDTVLVALLLQGPFPGAARSSSPVTPRREPAGHGASPPTHPAPTWGAGYGAGAAPHPAHGYLRGAGQRNWAQEDSDCHRGTPTAARGAGLLPQRGSCSQPRGAGGCQAIKSPSPAAPAPRTEQKAGMRPQNVPAGPGQPRGKGASPQHGGPTEGGRGAGARSRAPPNPGPCGCRGRWTQCNSSGSGEGRKERGRVGGKEGARGPHNEAGGSPCR